MAARESAAINLEAMTAATLLASLETRSARRRDIFYAAMDEISDSAFAAYRALVYETEGFRTFFRQMTPIAEIADLKIGSRPASRTKSDLIEDLRAIPWVFSWSQARVMLPGWYGAGHALHAFADKGLLRDMVGGLALLPHHARQYGDGAGQIGHEHRRFLCRAGRGQGSGAGNLRSDP